MTDQFNTRKTLLLRAKDPSDELAWSDFVEYYSGFISMLLFKMKIEQQLHEDLKQEILLKIWGALQDYEEDPTRAKFRTWLAAVIRNAALNYMRSHRSRERREDSLAQSHDLFTDENYAPSRIDEIINEEWAHYMVNHIIDHLKKFFSGKAIEVFTLSSEGIKSSEISRRLEIPTNTVYVLRNRVKARLMTEMQSLRQSLEF
ncbi:MAG: RNA polymerase sigma factor [Lentisphaeraceae bacterium]|nr:RNA polymerase sigma factor [Lentisphaeraceae bacterium]